MSFQPSLLSAERVSFDRAIAQAERRWLDESAWIDIAPDWIQGSDALFEEVMRSRAWGQRERLMYGRELPEPRLTSFWAMSSGEPLVPATLEEVRRSLSNKYGVTFDSVGFNLYRDGEDSVAWHRDRIRPEIPEPVVALVSLGERRRFLLRPYGGGASSSFNLGRGDLLVTGGRTQRTWEHTVPKVARAGPRISLAFRYGLRPLQYL
jgi:alkylated DNA repair dioxygenase AlkB